MVIALEVRQAVVENLKFLREGQKNVFSALSFCVLMIVMTKVTFPHLPWDLLLSAEDGPVERMTAGLWFMVCCWSLAIAGVQQTSRSEWLALGGLFLLLGLRELDAQRWVTGWFLDKLVNYGNPTIPLTERLFVTGFMIVPALGIGVVLVRRMWFHMRQGKGWRSPWMGQIAVGWLIFLVCVLLDKSNFVLGLLGIEGYGFWQREMEEFSEFVLAAYVVSVLWPYWNEVLFYK